MFAKIVVFIEFRQIESIAFYFNILDYAIDVVFIASMRVEDNSWDDDKAFNASVGPLPKFDPDVFTETTVEIIDGRSIAKVGALNLSNYCIFYFAPPSKLHLYR
jgi:hypothetical protein